MIQCIYIDTVIVSHLNNCSLMANSPALMHMCMHIYRLERMIEEKIAQDPLYIDIFTTLLKLIMSLVYNIFTLPYTFEAIT